MSSTASHFSDINCSSCGSRYAAFETPRYSDLGPVRLKLRHDELQDASDVQRQIQEATDFISSANQEISHLEEIIAVLRKRREEATSYLAHHSSLISPVRCLPVEILTKIFGMACSEVPALFSHSENDENYKTRTALSMSLVCSVWRQICLGEPSIWSTLSIFIEWIRSDEQHLWTQSPALALYLDRSRQAPLTLVIQKGSGCSSLSPDQEKMLALVVDHDHRWEHVIADESVKWFNKPRGHLPLLKKLILLRHGASHSPQWFGDALGLGEIVLNSTLFPDSLHWQNVVRLKIFAYTSGDTRLYKKELRQIQAAAPKLCHLHTDIRSLYDYEFPSEMKQQDCITFLCIQSLDIYDGSILAMITTPNLNNLTVHLRDSLSIEQITLFVQRSDATLTSLSLIYAQNLAVNHPQTLTLFRLACHVSNLSVKTISSTLLKDLYKILNIGSSSDSNGLLPRLTQLCISLSVYQCNPEIREDFVRMLESRRSATPLVFRKVTLDIHTPSDNEYPITCKNGELKGRLCRLEEKGLVALFNGGPLVTQVSVV